MIKRIKFYIIHFVFYSFIFSIFAVSINLIAETTTGDPFRSVFSQRSPNSTAELEAQILCAFESNNLQPTQRARALNAVRDLSPVIAQMQPPLSQVMIQNMLAQTVAETGNLRHYTEQRSSYASSRMKHRGRGLIQLTHRSNYANFAGCVDTIRNNQPPALITREALTRAQPIRNHEIVTNPDRAFNESTLAGQQLNAWTLLCYMIPNSERHSRFEAALNCANPPCVREVGVGVNRGPGALGRGRRPLGDQHRQQAFSKMNRCFQQQYTASRAQ